MTISELLDRSSPVPINAEDSTIKPRDQTSSRALVGYEQANANANYSISADNIHLTKGSRHYSVEHSPLNFDPDVLRALDYRMSGWGWLSDVFSVSDTPTQGPHLEPARRVRRERGLMNPNARLAVSGWLALLQSCPLSTTQPPYDAMGRNVDSE